MVNTAVLGANDEYVQQSNRYEKVDIFLALILYVIMVIEFLVHIMISHTTWDFV